jgi:hypothetical protein
MCKPQILSCNIINNCDVKAECKYSFDAQGYRCQCINGKNFVHNITFL